MANRRAASVGSEIISWTGTNPMHLLRLGPACLFVTAALPLLVLAESLQKVMAPLPFGATLIPPEVMQDITAPPWDGPEPGPVPGLRVQARERSGAIWLGGEQGAARFDPRAQH